MLKFFAIQAWVMNCRTLAVYKNIIGSVIISTDPIIIFLHSESAANHNTCLFGIKF